MTRLSIRAVVGLCASLLFGATTTDQQWAVLAQQLGRAPSDAEKRYITENVQREDVRQAFRSAAEQEHLIIDSDAEFLVTALYLRGERSVVATGHVALPQVRAVTASVLASYLHDAASGGPDLVGFTSRLDDALHLPAALFFPERNRYGKLSVRVALSTEFSVSVDDRAFPSPRVPLVVLEGSHAVVVAVQGRTCSERLQIRGGETKEVACPKTH